MREKCTVNKGQLHMIFSHEDLANTRADCSIPPAVEVGEVFPLDDLTGVRANRVDQIPQFQHDLE